MNPFALDAVLAAEFVASVPSWPVWLEPTRAAVAWDTQAAVWALHVDVRVAWTSPAFWRTAAAIAVRRTSLRTLLADLAVRADCALVHRGTTYSPSDRGRRLLRRWADGYLEQES